MPDNNTKSENGIFAGITISNTEHLYNMLNRALVAIILEQGGEITVSRDIAVEFDLREYIPSVTEMNDGNCYKFRVEKVDRSFLR